MTLLWAGLAMGAVYAIVAFGYNLVYLSAQTFNFAHAQLMMLGAFLAYSGLVSWSLPALVVAIVGVIIVFLVAAFEERIAIRPLPDTHNALVTTLGVSVLLTGVCELIWGAEPLTVPFFGGDSPVNALGGRAYPVQFALILLALFFVGGYLLLARYTKIGLSLSAMAEDPEAASLRGINVRRVAILAFAGSGAVAGLSGLFLGPQTYAVATLGSSLALKGFVALTISGFGNMPGTLIGGAMVGLVEALAIRYLGGEWASISVFLMLLTVLLVRPSGLFGHTKERTV